MESEKKGRTLLQLCLLLGVFFSQEALTLAMGSNTVEGGLNDQKNYYSPDPHGRTSPRHSHKQPSCPTPSHGGSGGATPHSPPTPTPSHGGGYYSPPSTPIITTPPTPIITTPPTPTVVPVIPTPLVPTTPPTPTFPVIPTPPATPFDPNAPPFTCDYWRTNPGAIWGLFGYWGTVGQLFGPTAASAFGRNISLLEALGNTRRDGIGALYREGTASFLNSMASRTFVYSTQQVRDAFIAAIVSDRAAAAQAQLFKKANGGHLKHY